MLEVLSPSTHADMIPAGGETESHSDTALSPRVREILLAQPLTELRPFTPQRYVPVPCVVPDASTTRAA